MKWIRWLAAAYFAVALYGAAQADDAPLSVTLYKAGLLVGIIVVLLAWDFIFNGNWNKPRKARSATRMICMITDSQGENESDILAPVRHEDFQARTLAGTRSIDCVLVDYDVLRGLDDPSERLF